MSPGTAPACPDYASVLDVLTEEGKGIGGLWLLFSPNSSKALSASYRSAADRSCSGVLLAYTRSRRCTWKLLKQESSVANTGLELAMADRHAQPRYSRATAAELFRSTSAAAYSVHRIVAEAAQLHFEESILVQSKSGKLDPSRHKITPHFPVCN